MIFTGERPTFENGLESSRMRYKSTLPFCINKNVVDFGCGIGIGSFFLSKFANHVIGYDISKEALNEASLIFSNLKEPIKNLQFMYHFENVIITCEHRDFHSTISNTIFNIIECIEHIEKNDLCILLNTIKKFDIICTTPNGDYFKYHPMTMDERRGHHVWHYTKIELEQLFKQYYKFVEVYSHIHDPIINQDTSYMIYATNRINWDDSFINRGVA